MDQQEQERYEIQGKAGEGGRGAVYRAYDRQLNRQVAIKRLFTETQGQESPEESYDAVMKESHALSAISSPHIVRVFDFATDEDGPYVVMEYLHGKTLHEVVSSAPLMPQDFMTVAEQALEALIAAHAAKLLHRDIKPGNLMLTWLPSGRLQLKLLDFGLAKFTERPAVQTIAQHGSVLGSIYFMAPEQFERTPLDVRSDLYSLGCVLYHALTGQFPFDGENVTTVMAAHLQGHYHELQPLRPDLAPAICRWVERLMAREMDDRPATAQEALSEFEIARRATTPVSNQVNPSGPRLITGINATQATSPEAGGPPSATVAVPTVLTTNQVSVHTTSVVADPLTRLVRTKSTTVPTWVFLMGGILGVLIVALGIAAAMRGDPAKPPPPAPEGSPDIVESPSPPPSEKPPVTPPPKPVKTPPNDKPATPPKKVMSLAEEFRRKDKDGDFVLSKNEFVGTKPSPLKAGLEKKFAELDKNRDGSLTMSEFRNRNARKPR